MNSLNDIYENTFHSYIHIPEYLLYKTLRSNKPYAVRHASERPSPKIFRKFLDPGEQATLAYPGPKISGKFWGLGCAL